MQPFSRTCYVFLVITGLSMRFISLTSGFTWHRLYPLYWMEMALQVQRKVGGNSDYLVSLPVAALLSGSSPLGDTKLLLTTHHMHFPPVPEAPWWLNRHKTIWLQNKSLLLTSEHFTNNIVNVRCYVLNQTTVVPRYYVHMANASVTFCYAGNFIGNQTYAPMSNYLCVYVKYTSFKLCVYEYER